MSKKQFGCVRDAAAIAERKDLMVGMRLEGFTLQAIGEKFGVSRQMVEQTIGNVISGSDVRRERSRAFLDSLSPEAIKTIIPRELPALDRMHKTMIVKELIKRDHGVKDGAVKKARDGERFASETLAAAGIENEIMPIGRPFDILLTASRKTVDVKTACNTTNSPSRTQLSDLWPFHRMAHNCADYFFLLIWPLKEFYFVPRDRVTSKGHIFISHPTLRPEIAKYREFLNNFNYLK